MRGNNHLSIRTMPMPLRPSAWRKYSREVIASWGYRLSIRERTIAETNGRGVIRRGGACDFRASNAVRRTVLPAARKSMLLLPLFPRRRSVAPSCDLTWRNRRATCATVNRRTRLDVCNPLPAVIPSPDAAPNYSAVDRPPWKEAPPNLPNGSPCRSCTNIIINYRDR